MIKNIIFDFGGVLFDWNPHYLFDWHFGNPEKTDRFINEICTPEWNSALDAGKPFAEGVKELVAKYPEWEREINLYDEGWIRMMAGQIPGMYEIVSSLSRLGYPVYGLTNWSAEKFNLIRNHYGILLYMKGIVVSGEEKMIKPAPEFYEILLTRYGLKAEECLFIDDNAANVAAAEALGIKAVRFVSPEKLREDLTEILGTEL